MSKKSSGTKSSWGYMLVWGIIGLLSVGYIGSLFDPSKIMNAQKPSLREDKTVVIEKHLAQIKKQIKSSDDLSNLQLKQLNAKYANFEQKLFALNAKLSILDTDNKNLTKRFAQIEESIGPITGALAKQASEKQTMSPIGQKITPAKIMVQEVKPKPVEEPKTGVKLAANIPIPVLRQHQKSKKPQLIRTQFAVSLGNFQDLQQLRKAWQVRADQFGSALGHLKPRFITLVVDNKPRYELITGPLDNALDAAKICYHLQQNKAYCKQSIYQGSEIQNTSF